MKITPAPFFSELSVSTRAMAWRIAIAILATVASPGAHSQLSLYRDLALSRFAIVINEAEATLKSDSGREISALPPLCYAYYKIRRYDKISWCSERLDQLIRAGKKIHTDGIIFPSDLSAFPGMLRSSVHLDFANYSMAVQEAEAALSLVNDDTGGGMMAPLRYRLELLPAIGVAAALGGKREKAMEALVRIEALSLGFTGFGMSDHKAAAVARVHMALGNCVKVLEYFAQGDQAGFLLGIGDLFMGAGEDSLKAQYDLSRALMAAKCLNDTGKVKEAQATLDAMLKHPRIEGYGELYWLALHERGRIAEAAGDPEGAVTRYRAAVKIVEDQRATINSEASRIGFAGDKQQLYFRLISNLFALGRVSEAFEYVERSKSRALVDMLAGKKDFAVAGGNAERVRELLAKADSAEASARAADTGEIATIRRSLVSRTRQDLAVAAPELTSLVTVSTLSAPAVQQALATDETLLEFYYSGADLYAFVVTREAISGIRLDAIDLDKDVQAFRKAVQAPASQSWKEPSIGLYQRLITPLGERLHTENLTIVPHGSLHYLPFNALSDGTRFLIERHSVRMLPAATVLKFLRASKTNKPGILLAFGNPDLGNTRYDLTFAQTEAETITKAFPNSRALVRKEASKTAFRKYASDFHMLHVASHGEFEADKPLASSLLLSPDGPDNGRLTVGELYSMRVDADLVTLSACETGLGKIANGDDVVGLTRGFLYAGASTIVASLWQVEDRSTGDLMTSFYQALAKGSGKRLALRTAQTDYLKTQPHPFFWAAFQLTGSP